MNNVRWCTSVPSHCDGIVFRSNFSRSWVPCMLWIMLRFFVRPLSSRLHALFDCKWIFRSTFKIYFVRSRLTCLTAAIVIIIIIISTSYYFYIIFTKMEYSFFPHLHWIMSCECCHLRKWEFTAPRMKMPIQRNAILVDCATAMILFFPRVKTARTSHQLNYDDDFVIASEQWAYTSLTRWYEPSFESTRSASVTNRWWNYTHEIRSSGWALSSFARKVFRSHTIRCWWRTTSHTHTRLVHVARLQAAACVGSLSITGWLKAVHSFVAH